MTRHIAAVCAFLACWYLYPTALAQDDEGDPEWCHDGWMCIEDEIAQKTRDKARAAQVLCEAIKGGLIDQTLSEPLRAVCHDAAATSRIWARAAKYRDAKAAADKAQRQANVREGRLAESRRQTQALRDRLTLAVEQRTKARQSRDTWRIIAVSAGGLAALSSVVWIGDAAAWWEL